ncbi:hypothetical protein PspLS_11478 [Pyricularia sp. CBS 133598]|nr:hypothetical protein PspLS_11478 [Pyricularia sp. CBS 133598]
MTFKMAATMIQQPYPIHQQHQSKYSYMAQPQGPPSPPMDDNKCSLPSISNLLGLADQGSPTSETSAQFREEQKQQQAQQSRPNSSHYSNVINSVRQGMPPTPPMTSEASFDSYNSPSTKSVSQLPATGYYFEATPPPAHMEMPLFIKLFHMYLYYLCAHSPIAGANIKRPKRTLSQGFDIVAISSVQLNKSLSEMPIAAASSPVSEASIRTVIKMGTPSSNNMLL